MARDSDTEDKSLNLDASSQGPGFVEREDDELWEVVEILDERPGYYKVRWAGFDPKTGKSWPPSWVPKADCTNPLVNAWRRKKAEKKEKSKRKAGIQSRVSAASTSSKPSPGNPTRSTISRSNESKSVTTGIKRKNRGHAPSTGSTTSRNTPLDAVSPRRPRKKRKISIETLESVVPLREMSEWEKEEEEEEGKGEGAASASRVRPARPRKRSPEVTTFTLGSEDDNEPPPRKSLLKKKIETTPPSARRTVKKQPVKHAHLSTISSRKKPSSASKSTAPSGSRLPSPSISAERDSENDEAIRTVSYNHVTRNEENAEELETPDGSPRLKSQPSRQGPHRRLSSSAEPGLASIPDRSRSGSRNASSHRLLKVGVIAKQPSAPSSDSETHRSAKGRITERNGSTSHQGNPKDDDTDGGLSYAEVDLAPLPPSTPIQGPLLLVLRNSPTPPPQVPDRKTTPRGPDVVPETEAEESQESQFPAPRHLIRTPSKNSVLSRMKPRTPGSRRNILDSDLITAPPNPDEINDQASRTTKQLRPLPHISPSKFTPHLPSSTIESAQNIDEVESSIEQFDSPVKSKSNDPRSQEALESDPFAIPPLAATDAASKGIALAEAAKRGKQLENGGAGAKYTLASLLDKQKEKARVSVVQEDHDRSRISHPSLEEFADSFVDYDGGMGDAGEELSRTEGTSKNPTALEQKVYLRQEEEENTQDLLNEAAKRPTVPDANEGWIHPSATESQHKSDGEEVQEAIESLEVAPETSAPTAEIPQSEQATASQLYPDQYTDRPSSPVEIPPTISPTRPVFELPAHQTQDGPHHLESAMNLLNRKSEEISRLENLFTTAQTSVQELQVENADFKAAAISWNEERVALATSLESAKKRQTMAEKDIDFFRAQYAQASAFVSEVQEENRDLQQRAEVAETQATTGLEGIRTMFEMRVHELENELKHHKRVAIFMIEQSQKTGDDEIRRRAAEYPEMERKHSEMNDMLTGAMGMVNTLEKQLSARDRDVEALKREKDEMQREVDGLKRTMGVPMLETDDLKRSDEERMDTNTRVEKVDGETQVYRCLWRKDGKAQCGAMFLDKEDLQRHLETGGHLQ